MTPAPEGIGPVGFRPPLGDRGALRYIVGEAAYEYITAHLFGAPEFPSTGKGSFTATLLWVSGTPGQGHCHPSNEATARSELWGKGQSPDATGLH